MSAAVFMRSNDNLRDAMPQTVPSPRGNPCEFGDFAADAFDLSLLPSPTFGPSFGLSTGSCATAACWGGGLDSEVPYSPSSVNQLMSLFCDAPMFDDKTPKQQEQEPSLKKVKLEPEELCWDRAFLFPVKQEADVDASVPQLEEQDRRDLADHHLLREVLKDTSFQRKFNLKPFDLQQMASAPWAAPLRRTLSGGASANNVKLEDDLQQLDAIEPMISLAIQQMRNEIGGTCAVLGIAPDPALWTREDVRAWVMWTVRQFSLPSVQLHLFDMEGAALAALSEHELTQRAPQSGSLLFAQLEIWKAACGEDVDGGRGASPSPPAAPLLHQLEPRPAAPEPAANNNLLTPPAMDLGASSPLSQHNSSASSADTSDDEDEDMDTASAAATATPGSASSSSSSSSSSRGSHIHLWQFLKELLASPQVHASCVRWVDRPGGVFKIEDSVRVARLWGARKNRPAMNYDKLSRSIRQYYKKGIMKKTERSQRLVYQFCHPYSL